jgi:hypothetical protein
MVAVVAAGILVNGCLSPETVRRIEGAPGQEGTGVFLSRLPEVVRILATYPASDQQRELADQRARAALAELKTRADTQPNLELPAVIAVDTEPAPRARGSRSVMLWNTQTEEIVGNDVYDVEAPPRVGDVAMWNQVSARYVGQGTGGPL